MPKNLKKYFRSTENYRAFSSEKKRKITVCSINYGRPTIFDPDADSRICDDI